MIEKIRIDHIITALVTSSVIIIALGLRKFPQTTQADIIVFLTFALLLTLIIISLQNIITILNRLRE